MRKHQTRRDRAWGLRDRTLRRRALVLGFLAVLTSPLVAQARPQGKVYRIGLLGGSSRSSQEASHIWAGFFEGLRALGFVEGQNIVIEERWYGDDIERLPILANELVRRQVDAIVVGTQPAPEAAKRATSTIPIIMINHGDPVGSGLVASLARPGGNVTGISLNTLELRGKQLQLLKDAVPELTSVSVLINPDITFEKLDVREIQTAARSLNIQIDVLHARAPSEFAAALSAATKRRSSALFLLGGSMYFAHRDQLVGLVAQTRLPAMYAVREYVEAGGLMSYGVNFRDAARQAAGYVGKILKGANPGDLPVEQFSKFEFAVNLRTARALGIVIPGAILARADHIIE